MLFASIAKRLVRTAPNAWRVPVAAGIVLALALAACSFVSNADEPQCAITADCIARGPAFAAAVCENSRCVSVTSPVSALAASGPPIDAGPPSGPWSCVGRVEWPTLTDESITDHHTFALTTSKAVIPGLAVKLCTSFDVMCASPKATVTTGDDGVAAIAVPKGFRGYLDLTEPPAAFPGLIPALAPYVPPPQATGSSNTPLGLDYELASITMLIREKINPANGYIFAIAQDCDSVPAEGLRVELGKGGEGSVRYYLATGLPAVEATETDTSGVAGFANVPPGIVSVTVSRVSTGETVATQSVLVRAGTLTIFNLPPTPL